MKDKRFFRLIISLSFICACFLMIHMTSYAAGTVWDGSVSGKVPSQDADGYYLLDNGRDLAWFAKRVNSGYAAIKGKMTSDIYLNNVSGGTYTNQWIPIGNYDASDSYVYSGVFDGDGHTVYGLYVNQSGASYQGLFGYLKGGSVKNVNIAAGKITAQANIGSICGYADNVSSIERCEANAAITATGNNIGGIAGYNYNKSSILNCGFTGSINGGSNRIGGITGCNSSNGIVSNCYNKADMITNGKYTGGIVGTNSGSSVSGCYNHGSVSGTNRIGGIVGNNVGKIFHCYNIGAVTSSGDAGAISGFNGLAEVENCYYNAQTSVAGDNNGIKKTTIEMKRYAFVLLLNEGGAGYLYDYTQDNNGYPIEAWQLNEALWNGTVSKPATTPDGSYYLINNGQELAWFAGLVNGTLTDGTMQNQYAKGRLTNSIILNLGEFMDGSNVWTPIGSVNNEFYGVLEGNGYTISGLYVKEGENTGLFGFIGNGAEVTDLVITESLVGGNTSGCLAGISYGYISSVKITYSTVNGQVRVGGFCGENGGHIVNSSIVHSEINGQQYVGGFIGSNSGNISTCYSISAVNGRQYVGGLTGANTGNMEYCFNRGDVTASENYVGGITGSNSGSVALSNCYNTGNISGNSYVGGIAGTTRNCEITRCYNVGNIRGSSLTGAVIGQYYSGNVMYCYYDKERYPISDAYAEGLTTEEMSGSDALLHLEGFSPSDWVTTPDTAYYLYYPQISTFVHSDDYDLYEASLESVYFLKYGLYCKVMMNRTITYYGSLKEAAAYIGDGTATILVFDNMAVKDTAVFNGNITLLAEKEGLCLTRTLGFNGSFIEINGTLTVGLTAQEEETYYPLVFDGGYGDKIRGDSIFKVNSDGLLHYNSGEIIYNFASSGGAIYNDFGTVNLNGGSIRNCYCGQNGAAVYNTGELNITGTALYDNKSYSSGGAVYSNGMGAVITVKGETEIYNNNAGESGGAFYINGGTVKTISGSLYNNTANQGGAFYNNAQLDVTGGLVYGNSASYGGAVYNNKTLNLSDNAYIDATNDVYLPDGKFVTMAGKSAYDHVIVNITPEKYEKGIRIVNGMYCALNYKKAAVSPQGDTVWHINSSGHLLTEEIVEVAIVSTFGVYNARYTSLKEAFEEIGDNAAVITMIEDDNSLDETITIRNDITIQPDTMARTISRANGFSGDLFVVENGATLTLGDVASESEEDLLYFDGGNTASSGNIVRVQNGTLVTHTGVVLHNNNAGGTGGTIAVQDRFIMNGGKIMDNKSVLGAVVVDGGTMDMYGGEISDNTVNGIYLDGILNMHSDVSVDQSNYVYVCRDRAICIADAYTTAEAPVASIDLQTYTLNSRVLYGEFLTADMCALAKIKDNHYYLTETGLLTSDKLEILPTSAMQFDRAGNRLTGIDMEVNTVENLLSQVVNENKCILDAQGNICTGKQAVGTGYSLALLNNRGEVYDSVKIIIFGDVDGDGRTDGSDSVMITYIFEDFYNRSDLTPEMLLAADANHDGKIDVFDQWLVEDAGIFLCEISQFIE